MKCKCRDCGKEFDYPFNISICDACLLKYNGKEFDRICNKCKKKILTIKKSVTDNNYLQIRRECMNEEHYCENCI